MVIKGIGAIGDAVYTGMAPGFCISVDSKGAYNALKMCRFWAMWQTSAEQKKRPTIGRGESLDASLTN